MVGYVAELLLKPDNSRIEIVANLQSAMSVSVSQRPKE